MTTFHQQSRVLWDYVKVKVDRWYYPLGPFKASSFKKQWCIFKASIWLIFLHLSHFIWLYTKT